MKISKNDSAYTLVEVAISIVIIMFLCAFYIPNYLLARRSVEITAKWQELTYDVNVASGSLVGLANSFGSRLETNQSGGLGDSRIKGKELVDVTTPHATKITLTTNLDLESFVRSTSRDGSRYFRPATIRELLCLGSVRDESLPSNVEIVATGTYLEEHGAKFFPMIALTERGNRDLTFIKEGQWSTKTLFAIVRK